ncbi:MAG: hypothetical protein NZU63_02115 [Gemmataceae bacterium]|nr:hypothetical protein [Gemmataceae bacterium]MDW8242980.1 hypothetical protein [Thermogemmata sp.]
MTYLGKILAVINVVLGVGLAIWSVSVYANRLPWYDPAPAPETIHPGHKPANFAFLRDELDRHGRAALTASQLWTQQRTRFEQLEQLRNARLRGYDEWIGFAKNGNPRDGGTGFYEPVYDPVTGLLDLTPPDPTRRRTPIVGIDNQPLRGVDTLGEQFVRDVAELTKLARQIDELRNRFRELGVELLQTEDRLRRMVIIRDNVLAELFYLTDAQWEVYEFRETVLRRQRQLSQRLAELR